MGSHAVVRLLYLKYNLFHNRFEVALMAAPWQPQTTRKVMLILVKINLPSVV